MGAGFELSVLWKKITWTDNRSNSKILNYVISDCEQEDVMYIERIYINNMTVSDREKVKN